MQPLKPYFLGQKGAPATLLTTYQKCFGQADIDEVGLDLLPPLVLRDDGQLLDRRVLQGRRGRVAWEFLTEHLQIDLDRLWVSVFAAIPSSGSARTGGDRGLGEGRPAARSDRRAAAIENFWQAGDTGPCGPCSERCTTTAARSSAASGLRSRPCVRALPRVLEPRLHGVRPRRRRC